MREDPEGNEAATVLKGMEAQAGKQEIQATKLRRQQKERGLVASVPFIHWIVSSTFNDGTTKDILPKSTRPIDQVTRLKGKRSARTRIGLPHFQASTGSEIEILLPLAAENKDKSQSLNVVQPSVLLKPRRELLLSIRPALLLKTFFS